MVHDSTNRFRRRHLKFLAVVFADQDDVLVRNPELNAYESLNRPPFKFSCPLMGCREIGNDRHRVNAISAGPEFRRFDTASQDGLLVVLVSDVNKRCHAFSRVACGIKEDCSREEAIVA